MWYESDERGDGRSRKIRRTEGNIRVVIYNIKSVKYLE